MAKKNAQETTPTTQETVVEKSFTVSKDFLGAVSNVLKGKPFITVANVMPLLSKEVMLESEINAVINTLGNLPYEEVAGIFAVVQQHVKLVEETPAE
jgi:hypothetical protein